MVNNSLSILAGKQRIKISTLSKETGISRGALTSIYYQENKSISFEILEKLCRYFNCGIGDLLFITDDKSA